MSTSKVNTNRSPRQSQENNKAIRSVLPNLKIFVMNFEPRAVLYEKLMRQSKILHIYIYKQLWFATEIISDVSNWNEFD